MYTCISVDVCNINLYMYTLIILDLEGIMFSFFRHPPPVERWDPVNPSQTSIPFTLMLRLYLSRCILNASMYNSSYKCMMLSAVIIYGCQSSTL